MIIKCPECGHDVSDTAKACPNCGFPIEDWINNGKPPINRKKNAKGAPMTINPPTVAMITIIVLCIVGLYFFAMQKNAENKLENEKFMESMANNDLQSDLSSDSASDIPYEYQQALDKGLSYLEITAYSRQSLYNQLQDDGFSYKACDYAVDNCGADWSEQAARDAKSYFDKDKSMSENDLKYQLLFDGFKSDEIQYGINAALNN